MKTVVFLGPSLARAEASEILDAHYLPPARRGDIFRALDTHEPDAILLIDGYFEQVPAPWHKEILFALSTGLLVAGASSMGALRAAELAQFGMIGTGRIFESYIAGKFSPFDDPFDGDDEVAVVHGPADAGYPASTALVDIRATLSAASSAGLVSQQEMHDMAAVAKRQFYKRRTWDTVLDASPLCEGTKSTLRRWISENFVSQKAVDAKTLLRQHSAGDLVADTPPFRFEATLIWEAEVPRLRKQGG